MVGDRGGDQKSDSQGNGGYTEKQQHIAGKHFALDASQQNKRNADQHQYYAGLDAVQSPGPRIPEIRLQGFEVSAAGLALKERDEILIAGEPVEQPRMKFDDLLFERLRRMLTAITQTHQPKTRVQRAIVSVIVRLSFISIGSFV